jgi:alkylated DNA repair dioxygenase AlkB
VLANQYRDGRDSMGWHADDGPELSPDPVIASLSLGAERRFDLRNKHTGETVKRRQYGGADQRLAVDRCEPCNDVTLPTPASTCSMLKNLSNWRG